MTDTLFNIHKVVERILEQYPIARDSDDVLYEMVVREYNPLIIDMRFGDVMSHTSAYNIPKYESVSRIRRKIQRKRADLLPSEKALDGKYENWKEYREYAVSEV